MELLKQGDIIGIISPSHVADKEHYSNIFDGIKSIGYRIKEGKNLYKNSYGYTASAQERADDFNEMVLDKDIKMILFGGGNDGNEILPFIDYDGIKSNPKIICSYSDGTSILNTIYAQTGIETYYGQYPGEFADLRYYNYMQFCNNFIHGDVKKFETNSKWKAICSGTSDGVLIGGYTTNFALALGNKYFCIDKSKEYILFLENHEKFCSPWEIAGHIAHIEQSELNVKGLLWGHYSDNEYPELIECLKRYGERNNIPVITCDDFGHGKNHGILTIGKKVRIDTVLNRLEYL
jgi:muramoyltetrapeptide carboxypeptidase